MHASSLERLSITAISRHPQIPIADARKIGSRSRERKYHFEEAQSHDRGQPYHKRLGRICPKLEFVEVELCGYTEMEKQALSGPTMQKSSRHINTYANFG